MPSVEDVENRAPLLSVAAIAVTVLAAFPALASFPVFTLFSALALAGVPGLLRRWGAVRASLRRRRRVLGGRSHQLLKLAAVEPHATAGGAHVELHAGAVHGLHRTVVIGA